MLRTFPGMAAHFENNHKRTSLFSWSKKSNNLNFGKGDLLFCCTGSCENYFGLVGRQKNNSDPNIQDCQFLDSGF